MKYLDNSHIKNKMFEFKWKKKVLMLIAKESQFAKKINNFKYVYIFMCIICFYVYICDSYPNNYHTFIEI